MSWQIAADVREMFVDVVAIGDSQAICARTLNRKDQLLSGLTEAMNSFAPKISLAEASLVLRSDWERVAIREHWGGHAAFLTTEGFENLLEIGDQTRRNQFGLHAEKNAPLISRDLSFGVTERTRPDGSIEVGLDEKEIDFVLSKLALAEVKSVALCFLHSPANPQHEKQLAAKLRDKGYEVFPSHEFKGHERERAAQACEKAFVTAGLKAFMDDIQKLGIEKDRILMAGPAPMPPANTLFCDFLEDRILARWNLAGQEKSVEMAFSPLCRAVLNEGGLVHVGPEKIDTEPGPVALGKGIHLCFLDVLAFQSKLAVNQIPRLKYDSNRVLKQLAPLAKQLQMDPETCARKYSQLGYDLMALELKYHLKGVNAATLSLECGGWLAPLMGPPLARRLGVRSFRIRPSAQWSRALDLLNRSLPASNLSVSGQLGFEQDTLSEGETFHA